MWDVGQKTDFPTCRHALWKLPQPWKSKSVAAHCLIDDFHRCLEKPALQNARRLSHSFHSAGGCTHPKAKTTGTIFSAEKDVDGGYGNPQKTRIPTATGNTQ
jgi:hypothetical protein